MDTLMTIKDVAEYLRVSKDTVYGLAKNGEIPAIKVGSQWRFRMQDVEKWLEANQNTAQKNHTYRS